ncbi:MAG: hypothetical protein EZS28_019406 [Streblomastix strix]|uniref:Uncharacterized protein n=1 Tax=Streblomastix strix TaxID=222440 RepID=A0A5J4VQW4_9EUKA|nr:MAG: hypothetical protein EZS28_019406 [Streblomastix strix]
MTDRAIEAEHELEKLRVEKSELEDEIKDLKKKIDEQDQLLLIASEQNQLINTLRQQLQKQDDKLLQVQKKLKEYENEVEIQLFQKENINKEYLSLQKRVKNYEEEKQGNLRKIQEDEDQMREIMNQIKNKEDNIKRLKAANEVFTRNQSTENKVLIEKLGKMEETVEERDKLKSENSHLTRLISQLKQEFQQEKDNLIKQVEDERERNEAIIAEMQNIENVELEENLNASQKLLQSNKRKYKNNSNEKERDNNNNNDNDNDDSNRSPQLMYQQQQSSSSSSSYFTSPIQNRSSSPLINQQIQQAQSASSAQLTPRSQRIANKIRENNILKDQLMKLQLENLENSSKLKEFKEKCDNLSQNMQRIEKEREMERKVMQNSALSTKKQNDKLSIENRWTQRKLKVNEEEILRLKEENEELKNQVSETEQVLGDIKEERDKLIEFRQKIEGMKDGMEGELSNWQSKIIDSERRIKENDKMIREMKDFISNQEEQIVRLKAENQGLRIEQDIEREAHKKSLDQAQSKQEEQLKEIQKLRQKLRQLQLQTVSGNEEKIAAETSNINAKWELSFIQNQLALSEEQKQLLEDELSLSQKLNRKIKIDRDKQQEKINRDIEEERLKELELDLLKRGKAMDDILEKRKQLSSTNQLNKRAKAKVGAEAEAEMSAEAKARVESEKENYQLVINKTIQMKQKRKINQIKRIQKKKEE